MSKQSALGLVREVEQHSELYYSYNALNNFSVHKNEQIQDFRNFSNPM